jgi:hypothetical protein
MPLQFVVPLIYAVIEFKGFTFITFGILGLFVVLSLLMLKIFGGRMDFAQYYNDIRCKLTNEMVQGIRVIKYCGLENVFVKRYGYGGYLIYIC